MNLAEPSARSHRNSALPENSPSPPPLIQDCNVLRKSSDRLASRADTPAPLHRLDGLAGPGCPRQKFAALPPDFLPPASMATYTCNEPSRSFLGPDPNP